MKLNLFERLSFFHHFLQARMLLPSTQLVYFHILWKWNLTRQANSFALSDSELQNKTRLGRKAITTAKRQLKNFNLIDFKIKNGITHYYLPEGEIFHGLDSEPAKSPQSVQKPRNSPDFPITGNTNKNYSNNKHAPAQGGGDYEF